MADEKKEPWLNYLAFTTIIFAVAATLSTSKGGRYSNRSLLAQEQASNKWSHYQSKSIKQYLYETQLGMLELEKNSLSATDIHSLQAYDTKISDFKQAIGRYEKEKDGSMADAKELEAERDEAQQHSKAFGMAVIFLQISILMSSIGALIKRKYLWYLAMGAGLVGLFYFVNGFLLFA